MENSRIETHKGRDTIFALATAQGRAGVAIIRVSGPNAKSVIVAMAGECPAPRCTSLRRLCDPETQQVLDSGLVLWFPGPASFTGEDMAEFHIHGSAAIIESISRALFGLGLRQAFAGEFTRRAFDNGRMDLTEAEGLADLIDAETEAQHQQALRQMQGGLRKTYEHWRDLTLDALAAIEGEIDFPDEQDVPDALSHQAWAPLTELEAALQESLKNAERGERIRHGLDIAIIGAPNSGKSSIINNLAGREAAIVSEKAGTTRDIIDVNMVVAGLPVRVSDTAGLRESADKIEEEGVRRAITRANDADIRIAVIDSLSRETPDGMLGSLKSGDIIVLNKTDLTTDDVMTPLPFNSGLTVLHLSALTGAGMGDLVDALEDKVRDRFSMSAAPGLTRARHRNCASRALEATQRAKQSVLQAPELAGDDLRAVLHAIKELAGETDIEAVLDRVFSRFCIGK